MHTARRHRSPVLLCLVFALILGVGLGLQLPRGTEPASAQVVTATFTVHPSAAAQPLNMPFFVTLDLDFSHTGIAGYQAELAFDPTLLRMSHTVPNGCKPPSPNWGDMGAEYPHHPWEPPLVNVATFCDDTTTAGMLETRVFTCLREGSGTIYLVAPGELSPAYQRFQGTKMFNLIDPNGYGEPPPPTTLVDAAVTCDTHVDDDNDGCGSSQEPAIGLDPSNPWDFFSVPTPALFVAPDPLLVYKRHTLSPTGAQAVFAYFKAGAHSGIQVYDQDLNANGIADGVEYDRSVVGPGKSGAPDGSVTAQDAQLAFAQFKLGYSC